VLTFSAEELRAFHDFSFTLESLLPLLDLEPPEREVFLRLRRLATVTTSEGREIVRLLLLSRGRSAFDLEQWIDRLESENSENDERPVKGSMIIRSLKQQIYPTLSRRQREIDETIEKMKLPNRVRVSPPENLEGDSYSCYVKFSQASELQRYIDVLQKAVRNGSVGRILELLDERGTE
jgi:hypothetical protein